MTRKAILQESFESIERCSVFVLVDIYVDFKSNIHTHTHTVFNWIIT